MMHNAANNNLFMTIFPFLLSSNLHYSADVCRMADGYNNRRHRRFWHATLRLRSTIRPHHPPQ